MPLHATVIPVTPFQQNCTLLRCEQTGEAAVVDPGGDLDVILDAAEKAQARITKILLTHAHIDHAGGSAELAERLGIPIEGPHREDQFLIDGLVFSFPGFAELFAGLSDIVGAAYQRGNRSREI